MVPCISFVLAYDLSRNLLFVSPWHLHEQGNLGRSRSLWSIVRFESSFLSLPSIVKIRTNGRLSLFLVWSEEKKDRARNTSLLKTWRMKREYKSSVKIVSLYLFIGTSFSIFNHENP